MAVTDFLAVVLTICLLRWPVVDTALSSLQFQVAGDHDDVIFNTDVRFGVTAPSTSACAKQCAHANGGCVAFTFSKTGLNPGQCRGYAVNVAVATSAGSASQTGCRTYVSTTPATTPTTTAQTTPATTAITATSTTTTTPTTTTPTTTTPTTTTPTATTPTTTTYVIVSDQCSHIPYTVLDDARRNVDSTVLNYNNYYNTWLDSELDFHLVNGWYRLQLYGLNGVMPTYCVDEHHCSAIYPMWLDLQGNALPTSGQEVTGRACEHCEEDGGCCAHSNPVTVRNCGTYFIYHLRRLDVDDSMYCVLAPTTTITTTAATVPGSDECSHIAYTVLDDARRNVDSTVLNYDNYYNTWLDSELDFHLVNGWYRLQLNGLNGVMPTYCVAEYHCSALYPMWLDLQGSALPTSGQEVTGRACEHCEEDGGCCAHSNPVTVRNCGTYFIYHLRRLDVDDSMYCVER